MKSSSSFAKTLNITSAAPYDEIAYQIRKSRGLPQPWQAEEKFVKRDNLQPQSAEGRKVVDSSESVETSLLGFVTHVDLTDRVTNPLKLFQVVSRNKYLKVFNYHFSAFNVRCHSNNT